MINFVTSWILIVVLETKFSLISYSIALQDACTFGQDSVSVPDYPVADRYKTLQRCSVGLGLDVGRGQFNVFVSHCWCYADHCPVERQLLQAFACSSNCLLNIFNMLKSVTYFYDNAIFIASYTAYKLLSQYMARNPLAVRLIFTGNSDFFSGFCFLR